MRLICMECGENFDDSDAGREVETMFFDGRRYVVERWLVCPYCGGEDLRDANRCPKCGEWKLYEDDYCLSCAECMEDEDD